MMIRVVKKIARILEGLPGRHLRYGVDFEKSDNIEFVISPLKIRKYEGFIGP